MAAQKPLAGVRVISMGQVLSGPLCSAFLADLGANVIKIESPGGDSIRGTSRELNGEPFSLLYEQYNRNKRSICLDIKEDQGQEIVYELLEEADVFLQNFGPGVASRLGVDEETVTAINPDIIYASISGYGDHGPLSSRTSFDGLVQHETGFASLQGFKGDRPRAARCHVADYFSGYNAAVSILAALYHRDTADMQNTPGGQSTNISMFESLIHNTNGLFELYNNLGEEPERPERDESRDDIIYGAERTKDGWVAVAFLITFPNIWEGFCTLLEQEDLLDDPAYETPTDRAQEEVKVEINTMLRKWLLDHTTDEAVKLLNDHRIPAAHHRTISEVPSMEHVQEHNIFRRFDHPTFEEIELTDTPLDLSNTPPSIDSPSPLLGEHTEEVLTEHGYSQEKINELLDKKIVSQA